MSLRKEAASLVKEITKHTFETCQAVINSGAIVALVSYLEEAKGYMAIPGILALGYIAAHSDVQALNVLKAHVYNQTLLTKFFRHWFSSRTSSKKRKSK